MASSTANNCNLSSNLNSNSFTLRVSSTQEQEQEQQQHSSNKFLRSNSTKEISSSDQSFPYTSPPLFSHSLHVSPVSSPLHSLHPPSKHHLLRPAHHRCVSSVLKKDGQILSIAGAANGLVYTGSSESGVVRVWRLPEFSECGQVKAAKAMAVAAVAASHNDRVYAAFADGKIRVWQRTWDDGGRLKHVRVATIPKIGSYVRSYISGRDKMTKHMGPITSLAMNVSDDILYSASVDTTVKVWRISDLKCIETIWAHPEPVNAVAVADDGVLFTASDDATVKVWRRSGGDHGHHSLTVTLPAKYSPVKALALTSDGSAPALYGGCSDGYVHYWVRGWHSGQVRYGGALQGHTHAVMCIASVAGFVVSGSADATCRVWARERDGAHSCVAVLVGHRGPVRCVAAFGGDEDGDACTICSGSLDGVLKVWRLRSGHNYRASPPIGCEYFDL